MGLLSFFGNLTGYITPLYLNKRVNFLTRPKNFLTLPIYSCKNMTLPLPPSTLIPSDTLSIIKYIHKFEYSKKSFDLVIVKGQYTYNPIYFPPTVSTKNPKTKCIGLPIIKVNTSFCHHSLIHTPITSIKIKDRNNTFSRKLYIFLITINASKYIHRLRFSGKNSLFTKTKKNWLYTLSVCISSLTDPLMRSNSVELWNPDFEFF